MKDDWNKRPFIVLAFVVIVVELLRVEVEGASQLVEVLVIAVGFLVRGQGEGFELVERLWNVRSAKTFRLLDLPRFKLQVAVVAYTCQSTKREPTALVYSNFIIII